MTRTTSDEVLVGGQDADGAARGEEAGGVVARGRRRPWRRSPAAGEPPRRCHPEELRSCQATRDRHAPADPSGLGRPRSLGMTGLQRGLGVPARGFDDRLALRGREALAQAWALGRRLALPQQPAVEAPAIGAGLAHERVRAAGEVPRRDEGVVDREDGRGLADEQRGRPPVRQREAEEGRLARRLRHGHRGATRRAAPRSGRARPRAARGRRRRRAR